jgi:integrase
MPSLTDGMIRHAIKRVEKTRKQQSLTDGEGRGTGRLVLFLKPMPTRVTEECMAQQWRDGRRTKHKIGSYPAKSLSEAREVFRRDFSEIILKGRSIKIAGDARPGTVADLFEAYVNHLKGTGKGSWSDVEQSLTRIADTLGRNRLARDITPDDVLGVIQPIYHRGRRAMADHIRSYVRSAYSWAIKSEHDYRSTAPRRFKAVSNPAGGIPTEPKVVGTRWLDEDEFARLYRWLECPDAPVHPPYTRAVRIIMLTGQRVKEIASLHVDQWDAKEKIIDWSKTKNGRPHAIPVPA